MRKFTGQRILITQSRLKNFAGSEVVTLELARYFSGNGSSVTILTNYFDDPMRSVLEGEKNIDVVITTTKEATEINVRDYDLVWIHHSLLTSSILSAMVSLKPSSRRPFVVFSHMSHAEPMEFPVMYEAEDKIADVVTFNASEVSDRILGTGVMFTRTTTTIFGNPAPDAYHTNTMAQGRLNSKALNRLAVVSNHIPLEIREAVNMLRADGIIVDLIGKEDGSVPQLITADILGGYDMIITIGKTVQYCIAAGVPVYCYDHFGGSGFITRKNFEKNKYHNFSGRGFMKKEPKQIHREISSHFDEALMDFQEVRTEHAGEFVLSKQIERILGMKRNETIISGKDGDIASYAKYLDIVNSTFPANFKYLYQLHDVETVFRKYRLDKGKELQLLSKENKEAVDKLESEIRSYKTSKAYKFYLLYASMIKKLRRR